MSDNLKHPFIYVLELMRIVTPAKARLAFISNLNKCDEFHYYCKCCGVKLKGRNIVKRKLEKHNQQPSCADWPKVDHKPFCQESSEKQSTSSKVNKPNSDNEYKPDKTVFIPEYLTFEIPKFIIRSTNDIPEEIDINILNNTPVDLQINELSLQNSTYLLKDVLIAYEWLRTQKIDIEKYPKVWLGSKEFPNRYFYLVKPYSKIQYKDNIIYQGEFDIQFASVKENNFIFYPIEKIEKRKIKYPSKICIPLEICHNTDIEDSINKIINNKKDTKNTVQKVKFYITGHHLPETPQHAVSKNGVHYNEYMITITNPYLIVFIFN